MSTYLNMLEAKSLRAFPSEGVAYIPVHAHGQKVTYFDEYEALKDSPISDELLLFRSGLVHQWADGGKVLDVGIGSGAFVESHGDAVGFDVDPKAVDWLEERGLYCDPYVDGALEDIKAVTFWDSLEHIRDPDAILDKIGNQWVFVAIPIFGSMDKDVLTRSKHFKRNEHYWYFTWEGLLDFMEYHGFAYKGSTSGETDIGREGIITVIFRRGKNRQNDLGGDS